MTFPRPLRLASRQAARLTLLLCLALSTAVFVTRPPQARSKQESTPSRQPAIPIQTGQPLPVGLNNHTATLLPDGRVLVAGGTTNGQASGAQRAAYLYNPATGLWTPTGSLNTVRYAHFAVLLQSGRVLVAGGQNGTEGSLRSAELYDPVTGGWQTTGSLSAARYGATGTLLTTTSNLTNTFNGFVLAAGGRDGNGVLNSAELYNPATGVWRATGTTLRTARAQHNAVTLSDGTVLVSGGRTSASAQPTLTASAEIYDPFTERWLATGALGAARENATATLLHNGQVLLTGGRGATSTLDTTEFYNPSTRLWAAGPRLNSARERHTASLLPNGHVLVTGGFALNGGARATAETYDPAANRWENAFTLSTARGSHTAVLLANARVLLIGGTAANDESSALTNVDIHDPASGFWQTQDGPNVKRSGHTATLLPNGKVLIAGGNGTGNNNSLASAELYDPASGTWSSTGSLNAARQFHTATLLNNGLVLVAGGRLNNITLNSAELYNPVTGTWRLVGSDMVRAREFHTATLLPDGRVLLAGGRNGNGPEQTTELFDPAKEALTAAASMRSARNAHTATLLFDGRVLVVGGAPLVGQVSQDSAELYTPTTNTWVFTTNPMTEGRAQHTATLLPNGKVLVVAGVTFSSVPFTTTDNAELFDPALQSWTRLATNEGRYLHTATLLPNGKVLIVGGGKQIGLSATSELYDPASRAPRPFEPITANTLNTARDLHTATLLPNGKVLIVGGFDGDTTPADTNELFDVGLNVASNTAPGVSEGRWAGPGNPACVTGIRFQGASEASGGGTQSAAANYPIVQLRRLDNEQTVQLLPDPNASACGTARGWTNNGYASRTIPATATAGGTGNLPAGAALLTVFTNGVPNTRSVLIAPPGAITGASTVSITGRIFTIDNAGFAAKVELFDPNGISLGVRQTNANGEYIFENVPAPTPSPTPIAPGTVTGVVRNAETNQPLANATVTLVQLNRTVTTGNDGAYEFRNVPAGTYTLRATAANLATQERSITLVSGQASEPQDFSLPANSACTYSLSPNNLTAPASGSASNTLSVTAQSGCAWTAFSNATWVTIVAGATGTGNGTVTYSVAANQATVSRTGTIRIGGQVFTVTQTAAPCSYSLSPSKASFDMFGGVGSATVNTSFNCAWTAAKDVSWITITSGASGTGPGVVRYQVASTFNMNQRAGQITVMGKVHTVIQNEIIANLTVLDSARREQSPLTDLFAWDQPPAFTPFNQVGNGSVANQTTPEVAQQQGTYTIIPSGLSPRGNLVIFFPPVVPIIFDTSGAVAEMRAVRAPLAGGNGNSCAQTTSNNQISGQLSPLGDATGVNVQLTITNQRADCGLPTNVNTELVNNGVSAYLYAKAGLALNGDYDIEPMSALHSFSSKLSGTGKDSVKQLDGTQAGRDFTVTPKCGPINFDQSSLPNGMVGINYSQRLTVNNGTGSFAFTRTGNLPPNLSLMNDGTLSGVPTQAGTYNFTATAAANGCAGSRDYSMTISTPNYEADVNPRPNGNGQINVLDFQQIGQVLAGIGAPFSGSEFQRADCAPRATKGDGRFNIFDFQQAGLYAANLDAPVEVGGPTTPITAQAEGYAFQQATHAPLAQQRIVRFGTATVNSNGTLSVPLELAALGGEFGISLSVTYDQAVLSNPLLALGSSAPAGAQFLLNATQANQGRLGVIFLCPFNFPGFTAGTQQFAVLTFTISPNAPATTRLGFGDVPIERLLSDTNLNSLTGTVFTDSQIQLRSCPSLTITPATLPGATVGAVYQQALSASGGTAPYGFALAAGSALPAGLSLANDGTLSGTPTMAGNFSFTVNVTDTNNCTGSAMIALTVVCPTITINPPTLPNLVAGQPYSQPLTASGGTPNYSFTLTGGALPNGLALSSAGVISGVSNATGTFTFSVTVTDSRTCTGTRLYTLSSGCPTLTLTPASLPSGTTGTPYTQAITVSGGGTFAFTNTGTLPTGLTLASNGTLSGTPTAMGTFNFTVIATNTTNNCTAQQSYNVTINCAALTINPPTLPNGTAGQPYSVLFSQAGGSGAIAWSVSAGTPPNGLTLNPSTGVLSGTPSSFGTTNFSIRATDANGCTGTRAYTLTLNPPACPTITINPATLANGAVGSAYSVTFSQTGGSGTLTWSISAGVLPNGLTLNPANGLLSGTPSAPGTFSFTVRVTDANNCPGTRTYTVNITCGYTLNIGSNDFPAPGGNARVEVSTANGCAWTATSNAPWLTITSGSSGNGNGTVSYTASANTGAARNGSLTIAGINFVVTQQGTNSGPLATVSAATFRATLAPESIAAAFGLNLATQVATATSTPLPTTLAGTTLRVRDSAGVERAAPLFFVAPGQINYQVPAGTALGLATLTVTSGNGQISSGTAQISLVSPGFFTATANGQGVPTGVLFRVRGNGQQVIEEIARADGTPLPIDLGPAGDQVLLVLFGTGVRGLRSQSNATVTISGLPVQVPFASAQGGLVGLDQLNIGPLPRALAGRGLVDLVLTVEGQVAPTVQVRFQ